MTSSPFDQQIDRTAVPTMKWDPDKLAEFYDNREALPFWVADMDFPAPPSVVQRITHRAEHGVYGYGYQPDALREAMLGWYVRRQNWTIDPETVEQCPSVLNAIAVLIDQHTDEGDGVIVQPPVFFEFRQVITANKRRASKNRLKLVDGRYEMDFDDLEAQLAKPKNKVMIICNPHNPVGRVWTRYELTRAAELCKAHDVLLISDEIHGDIIYPPHTFTPALTLPESLHSHIVACLSPAKTFNIAGMIDARAS
ncbi:MAG: aminotransferase class I/II-fold pyridoxal phosphate-dependent enzyme, partial [Chloroflexota bacterium]